MDTMTRPDQLHHDCIEDCCWPERLRRAGGPTPITTTGVVEAIRKGTLQSTDDGWTFRFEGLPRWSRSDMAVADALRGEWKQGKAAMPNRSRSYGAPTITKLAMNDRLDLAITAAIELLGVETPAQCAAWLGIPERLFEPHWFTKRAVHRAIRDGLTNAEIMALSRDVWGVPVTSGLISKRRSRLRLRGVDAPTSAEAAA